MVLLFVGLFGLVVWLVGWLWAYLLVGWLVCCWNVLFGCLVGWLWAYFLVGWLAGLVCWFSWLVGWFVSFVGLVGWLVSWFGLLV